VLACKVVPPSQVSGGIPPLYDAVVMKGLAKDPAHRYATAREMALALEACGGTESLAGVATWLEGIAGESLTERADRLARLERGSEVSEVSELRVLVDELSSGTSHRPPSSTSAVHARSFADAAASEVPARDAAPERRGRRGLVWLVSLIALLVAGAATLHFAGGGSRLQSQPEPSKSPVPAKPAPLPAPAAAPAELATSEPEPPAAAPAASEAPSTASRPVNRQRQPARRPAPTAAPSKPASPFSDLGGRQ
jgi:serine/threonine-protein kinase